MIYDCFLFSGEAECLEIRVREMADIPDVRHLAIVSDTDFRGGRQSVYAQEVCLEMVRQMVPGVAIGMFVAEPVQHSVYPRERESHQRNAISQALAFYDAQPDDIVIISDVDEIPKAGAVKQYAKLMEGVAAIRMSNRCYWLDAASEHETWDHARIMRRRDMEWLGSPDHIRLAGPHQHVIGGWHFSWLGGPGRCLDKLGRFSHHEVATPDRARLERMMEGGTRFWDGHPLARVPLDGNMPKCVKNDPARWSNHLWSKP